MLLKKFYHNFFSLESLSQKILLKLIALIIVSTIIQSCTVQRSVVVNLSQPAPIRNISTPEKINSKNGGELTAKNEDDKVKITVSENLNNEQQLIQKKYSLILHVPQNELKNIALYELIDKWWGVKYKYAGNDQSGIDCSGFSCMLLSSVYGVKLTRGSRSMYAETQRVKKEDLTEGDLVFFKIKRGRVSHVGVYLMNNYFVHASVRNGVTISSLDDDYYKKVFCSGGRWRK